MMTAEEVAERYHDRTGFRLIDYREVALPTYSVSTRVLTLARKRIPVIEEFLLRGLAAELSTPEELAAFFGLDQRIVNGALADLATSDDVALGPSDTSRRQMLRLTAKGHNTLENLESVVPEERVIPLPFDAILRRLREQPGVAALASRDVDAQGLFRLPPTKVRKPELADVTPEAVEALLRRMSHDADGPRDVLAVKAITRCDRKFIPAIGLLYESERGGEYQLAFAIDGILSPEHESAFAAAGGLTRLKIAESVGRSKHDRNEDLVRAITLAKPALETDAELRRITAQRKSELRTLREQAQITQDSSRVNELQARIEDLERSLASAEASRAQIRTRFLYCYDHAPLLHEALATAKSRVLIISPWIRSEVLDDQLKAALAQLLSRGVDLYIGWGYPGDERPSISAGAQRFLESLARQYKNFHFKEFGNTHAKVLLVDTEYVVHTSFNWLSFRGDPDRTFRDEQGVLVADAEQVEQKFQELLPRFHK